MGMKALYRTEEGQAIATHSMVKTFGRCPRQAMYKYADRLKPKVLSIPLKRGNWMHALLEAFYTGKDWRKVHKRLSQEFALLFDEEREKLGDLPTECKRLMQSYLWHYRHDEDWKVLEVEYTIETELPDGTLYRGRVDMLVETPFGLYIVDHKTHKSLPDNDFRLQDPQSALYIWAARKLGLDVQGFIWNYIRTSGPKPIKFTLRGEPYKRQGETDFLTARRSIIDSGRDPKDYQHILVPLKNMRYRTDETQLSPFFYRHTLEKDDDMLDRVLAEKIHTIRRMNHYPFNDRDSVERVFERSCKWMCAYKDICLTDLMGGNSAQVIRAGYKVGDPLDYYQDQPDRTVA